MGKCQGRDFTEPIAAMSLAMIQYNVLAFVKGFEAYETIGGLWVTTNSCVFVTVTVVPVIPAVTVVTGVPAICSC